jgi:PTH1 family peptidyl-tRNA hydrolase
MKLIVGLGNPGPEYEGTRHNAGFMVVDRLMSLCALGESAKVRFKSLSVEVRLPAPSSDGSVPRDPYGGGVKCLLLKPITFMNLSGRAVSEALRFYKLDVSEDLLVVTDDVALPAGALRMRAKGGAGGHNGLSDIERLLGTQRYARLRVGVDPPGVVPQVDYVLGRFSPEQRVAMEAALPLAAAACAEWANRGVTSAMNAYNTPGGGREKKTDAGVGDRSGGNGGGGDGAGGRAAGSSDHGERGA